LILPQDTYKKLSQDEALKKFIYLLQNAHAGEKAAANAYWGHGHSLFLWNANERKELDTIYREELHHRRRLREMLTEMGAKPRLSREVLMYCIGATICVLCLFGGWYIPMYGAGKLESTNIVEYEIAARLAYVSGNKKYIDELLDFAELEWDHEQYFYNKSASHFLFAYSPKWIRPPGKSTIKDRMNNEFIN
jgi:hypothetical protein